MTTSKLSAHSFDRAGRVAMTPAQKLRRRMKKEQFLYMLLLPGLLYFIVYRYSPLAGMVIAFQDYSVFRGFWGSDWVGLKHFYTIFDSSEVLLVFRNTLWISLLQLVIVFPLPIVLALMLNELRSETYKRTIQSIVYLPYFLSWVVVVSMTVVFMKQEGLVNWALGAVFGLNPIAFLQEPGWFVPTVIAQLLWKEAGWSTIIFLAALAGVNSNLYEAAVVDGASRLRRIWHVTLPAIRSVIVILIILRLGDVLDVGFQQIFLMQNPMNKHVSDVLETYVYWKGIVGNSFSFATAVGLFKSVVGLVLIAGANRLSKKFGEEGLY